MGARPRRVEHPSSNTPTRRSLGGNAYHPHKERGDISRALGKRQSAGRFSFPTTMLPGEMALRRANSVPPGETAKRHPAFPHEVRTSRTKCGFLILAELL